MTDFIQVTFPEVEQEQAGVLIAALSENGFDGFEEKNHELNAFIPAADYNESWLTNFCSAQHIIFQVKQLAATNWNEQWESSFTPVIIPEFVAVRADFHAPVASVIHDIIITPKMSFGTGHHATTYMMMEQMKTVNFTGKSVFDFGTGTGILSILAEKLGASSVQAIDHDEWCIVNAAENVQRNNSRVVTLQQLDHVPETACFDIILANITKNIILENFKVLTERLNKNGILLLSGLLAGDENEINQAARQAALIPGKRLEQLNWLCLKFLR